MMKVTPSALYESKWRTYWEEQGFFRSKPSKDKKPFGIAMPPPNVTGTLHMGHTLNQVIQDVLARRKRMEGREVCWVPGTDHASIATEAKVVDKIEKEGHTKHSLGREAFLKEARMWKEKYGIIIIDQLKKLGISCDWERYQFTMDEAPSEAVIQAFITLYERGLIYRDRRMIHWDPKGRTSLSNEEVIYRERKGNLYHIAYPVPKLGKSLTVATTRPETMLGDVAICVHPDDSRYKAFHGAHAVLPLVGRELPIIADPFVERAFGTGCVKITPAHDTNDYEVGIKHGLPLINIMTDEGKINENGGTYAGQDRFAARKKIVSQLKDEGFLQKVTPHTHKVGFSERSGAMVEPRISLQWFLGMEELAQPAIQAVEEGTIQFHPHHYVNTYYAWMRNIRDWCISRQLWWGHRIPVYYLPDERFVVAKSREEALEKARALPGGKAFQDSDLRQEEDVLDTWFSSWLWPINIFDGIRKPDNADFQYYYPTDDLVTAPEIIFFWVARMIMAGYAFTGKAPFRDVYFTGIVRDKQRRKMSKSLGNSPNPLALIEKYGVDGVRAGMLFSSPAGNDLLFDEKECEQGKKFVRKLQSALHLVQRWKSTDIAPTPSAVKAMAWFDAALNEAVGEILQNLDSYRISEAFVKSYSFIWNQFCAHYLEMVKPGKDHKLAKDTYERTVGFFETLMALLHPFMPFITEEIWHQLRPRKEKATLCLAPYPAAKPYEKALLQEAAEAFSLITKLRQIAKERGNTALVLSCVDTPPGWFSAYQSYIEKAANLKAFSVDEKGGKASQSHLAFIIGNHTFWVEEEQGDSQRSKLEEELANKRAYIATLDRKLANPNFRNRAPAAIVAAEEAKYREAQERIACLEGLLA